VEWQKHPGDILVFPVGAVGWPSAATRAKGEAALESIRRRLVPFLKDRIERLRREPRYAGAGGLSIRKMMRRDIPEAMRLKTIAGWNQTEATWEYMLDASPDGCFVMVHQGRVVATVTTCRHGSRLGWIGMMLVDPTFRRMGIATRLMNRALEALRDCAVVKLDATAEGKKVYEQMGFADQHALARLCVRTLLPVGASSAAVEPVREGDLPAIMEMDGRLFGADRSSVLRAFWKSWPHLSGQRTRGGAIEAYCFGREGSDFCQIGPVAAESAEAAIELTRGVLAPLRGRAVLVDVPEGHPEFREFLATLGFVEQRSLMRMARGADACPDDRARIFAAAGPELG
jgi:GNAT superfamily N-acetyltransferase